MTAAGVLPAFSPNGAPDEQWEAFRSRAAAGDWGIPKGTYDATVLSVRLVQRRDTAEWGLRILFRADRLGLDGYAWRPLSRDPDDPLSLTRSQARSLRDWAARMQLDAAAPGEIVDQALALVGRRVVARVSVTPVGARASLSRSGGPVPDGRGESGGSASLPVSVAAASPSSRSAHAAHTALTDAIQNINALWMIAAEACYHLREGQGWTQLGFSSLNEYLAQPEVTLQRRKFLTLAQIWDVYVVQGGVEVEQLAGTRWSKLALTLPATCADVCTVQEAVSDAEALGIKDLREKYAGGVGADTSGGREVVTTVIVSPLLDPERGHRLELRLGDRVAELDVGEARRTRSAIDEWLRQVAA